jgi:hypothetical protein
MDNEATTKKISSHSLAVFGNRLYILATDYDGQAWLRFSTGVIRDDKELLFSDWEKFPNPPQE